MSIDYSEQSWLDSSEKEYLPYKDITWVAHIQYWYECTGFHLYILGHWVIPFSFCLYELCLFRKTENSFRAYIFWLLAYSLSQMSNFKLLATGQWQFTLLLNFGELVKLEVRNTSKKEHTALDLYVCIYVLVVGYKD